MRHGRAAQADRPATEQESSSGTAFRGQLLVVSYPEMDDSVEAAVAWLQLHPHRDYIDAAFAIAADPYGPRPPGQIATSHWPEFVSAVKEATQNQSVVA
jgi:hypothetical protein